MSSRLPFLLLVTITLLLVSATIVEKLAGTEVATRCIYLSPILTGLWGATAVTGIAVVLARRMAMGFGSLLLHLSLVLILAGAAMTRFTGEHGNIKLISGESPVTHWTLSDGSAGEFPFEISLVECGTEYHSSEVAVRDYFSILLIDGREERVSMNHVVDHRGYRFTQSSIGAGTATLSVSHDPWGRMVSFTAYAILFISMVVVLAGSPRFHLLLRKSLLPVLILLPSLSWSQPRTLQAPLARTFGDIFVVSGGRICPAQTFARDFCNKVYGSDSYEGLSAEQVLTGWIYYYDSWKHEPFITLHSREARELLGKKRVSLSELFTRDGYILKPLLEDGSHISRDLLADDEKVTFISSVVAGRLPAIFAGDSFEGSGRLEEIASDIAIGRYRNANSRLKDFRIWQRSVGSDRLPSPVAISAEKLYNITYYPLLAAIVAFSGGLVGLCRLRRGATVVAWAILLYLSSVIAMRWIAGGHIPLATGYETMLCLAWCSALTAVVCTPRLQSIVPLGLLVCGASLMVAMMSSRNPAVSPLVPVLASRLLSLHVMLVMSAYALLAIIALNSAIGLAGRGNADTSRFLLYPALFLLGAGIFVGAIWADRSWGRYWGWDPKETWALVTFIIYSFPLHDRTFTAFRNDRCINLYLLFAFLSVLMTYFGVNYLLSGLHSYGVS